MKRSILCCFVIPLMASALSLTSCIYEASGDGFYRTLWKSSTQPLGAAVMASDDWLALEFLCDNKVTLTNSFGTIVAYGNYTPAEDIAVLSGVQTWFGDDCVVFAEAIRNGDTLLLSCHREGEPGTEIIRMDRLSSYSQLNR